MTQRHPDRMSTYAACLLVSLLPAAGCSTQRATPGSSDQPVTVERLTGARLQYHRADPELNWSFGDKEFVLEIGGETVPRQLIQKLTGNQGAVARIEGTWSLDEQEGVLNLSVHKADGLAIDRTARLPILAAGMVRVDLGDYQYNVLPDEARLSADEPQVTFLQDGDDLVVSMTIELVDAPHVLWTRSELVMDHDPYLEGPRREPRLDRVELSYEVIQCRDDPNMMHLRHRKKTIDVTWRIRGHEQADVPYRVARQFQPSAAELLDLAERLKQIAAETQSRGDLATPGD